MKSFDQELPHLDDECPRLHRRIACEACGYPPSEAAFDNVREYIIALEKQLLQNEPFS